MKTNYSHYLLIMLLSGSLMLSGCGIFGSDDDDDTDFEDGISNDIRDILDDDLIDMIENDLDVPIHRGDNPPYIEGAFDLEKLMGSDKMSQGGISFAMAPMYMHETVVPDDAAEPGHQFWDLYFLLGNQDMDNYTIDMDMRHIEEANAEAHDAFIIGDDNKFTIVAEARQEREPGRVVVSSVVFSAEIGDDGMANPYMSFIMIDNADFEDRIPDGTGRSFVDGDDHASLTDWPGHGDEEGKPGMLRSISEN